MRFAASKRPSVIDLFSGAGLFGLGFKAEGFDIVGAYENDPVAASTNRRNLGHHVEVADLSRTRPKGRCNVLIAGPPCQGFSSIGARKADDPRNNLCMVVPAWARVTKPQIVVVENVPQFLKSASWSAMTDEFKDQGYKAAVWTLNAKHFGVPQNRMRSITVYFKRSMPDLDTQRSTVEATIAEAFAGLPRREEKRIQHFTLKQSEKTMRKIRLVPYGGDVRDIFAADPTLVCPSWIKVREKIIDIWGRLTWDGISNTIRTGFLHPSRGRFLHPVEDRPISFREAARLQCIPDDFLFDGLAEQIARQIGNGVPYGISRAVARSVADAL